MKRLVLHIDEVLLFQYEEKPSGKNLASFSHYIETLSNKYEVWILCNAAFPKSIITLRQSLKKVLSLERIILFYLPFQNTTEAYQIAANQYIENYSLTQLHPHIVLSINKVHENHTVAPCHISVQRIKKETSFFQGEESSKPSLAYFSPMPPEKSGIAHYSRELLPHLSQHYDITLILDQKEITLSKQAVSYPVLSVDDFKKQYQIFDRILYHFGNSFYHSYMWPLLKAFPGIVVLHDFFLSGLLSYEELVKGKTCWTEQLFTSHGYHALQILFESSQEEALQYRYPCNFEILQYASGIITHSAYAKNLAQTWYRINPLAVWETIPLLREAADNTDKKQSRSYLGLPEDALVICSFGVLNATKLNHLLLQAFIHSNLSSIPNCYLIFVGENNSGTYAIELEKSIRSSGFKNRIKITGWIDDSTFHHYLNAADIGVQLRTASRGESSASVLDCMNYGLATIVNANGSMAELPKNALYMLEDDFETDALIKALNTLGRERALREGLGKKAKALIHTTHTPLFCASRYHQVIESTYRSRQHYDTLIHSFAKLDLLKKSAFNSEVLVSSITKSTLPTITQRQILIDVSVINRNDMRTGIERVVRAQLLEIIKNAPDSVRVEPVYLDETGSIGYRYARNFASAMMKLPVDIAEDPVVVNYGDIFYAPDFYPQGVIHAARSGLYEAWSAKGVKIAFLIHDILPIQYPHFFPEGSSELHTQWMKTISHVSDILICTSHTGKENVQNWIHTQNIHRNFRGDIAVESVYLGSDITASSPSSELSEEADQILEQISQLPTFLMVGTIEPRKGHLQTIAAFDTLWGKGLKANLVIVGKEGWKGLPDPQRRTIPEITTKIKTHTQLGKHLLWLNDISDLFLERLYRTSTALIIASEDEGFGLPLIEGANHRLPLIARDIPIFRELAEENAFYFTDHTSPEAISDSIELWMTLYHDNKHPLPDAFNTITWKESAQGILEVLLRQGTVETPTLSEGKSKNTISKHSCHLSLRAEELYQSLTQSTQDKMRKS